MVVVALSLPLAACSKTKGASGGGEVVIGKIAGKGGGGRNWLNAAPARSGRKGGSALTIRRGVKIPAIGGATGKKKGG